MSKRKVWYVNQGQSDLPAGIFLVHSLICWGEEYLQSGQKSFPVCCIISMHKYKCDFVINNNINYFLSDMKSYNQVRFNQVLNTAMVASPGSGTLSQVLMPFFDGMRLESPFALVFSLLSGTASITTCYAELVYSVKSGL